MTDNNNQSALTNITSTLVKTKAKKLFIKQLPIIIMAVLPWLVGTLLVVGGIMGLSSILQNTSQSCDISQVEQVDNTDTNVETTDTIEFCGDFNSIIGNGYISNTGWTEPTRAFLSGTGGLFNSTCLTSESPCPPWNRRDRLHKGIDLTTWECNTSNYGFGNKVPIFAASNGIIESVRTGETNNSGGGSYGNYAIIRHKDAFVKSVYGTPYDSKDALTIYAHMLYGSPIVVPGQSVVAGQVIGYMGNTGASTGCHLHFEIHYDNILPQTAIDPISFFAMNGIFIK